MRRVVALASTLAVLLALVAPGAAGAWSTDGNCLGLVAQAATVERDPGYWSEGTHTVALRIDYMGEVAYEPDPVTFTVTAAAPMYPGQVHVGEVVVWGRDVIDSFNPAQDTYLWTGWFWDMTGELFGGPPMTMLDVKADAALTAGFFSIDGGPWIATRVTPPRSVCANGMLSGMTPMPMIHRTWRH